MNSLQVTPEKKQQLDDAIISLGKAQHALLLTTCDLALAGVGTFEIGKEQAALNKIKRQLEAIHVRLRNKRDQVEVKQQ
jgi:hypothetical protein